MTARRAARAGHRRDEGFVTAETAVLLPALVLVVTALLVLVHAASLQTMAQDAAAMGARSAARGEDDAQVRAAALRVAASSADVTVRRAGGLVTVDVRVPVALDGPLGRLLGPVSVSARSVAADEAVP
jgi:Flp pilus assembly protein TadG